MWILNDIKIATQCVCIDFGKDGNTVYPVMPNFMEKDSMYLSSFISRMLGREQIFVEYLNREMVLDHWVKGPHHVWKDP